MNRNKIILLPFLILFVLTAPSFLSVVYGWNVTDTLPNNTIFFDDFENTNHWFVNDACTGNSGTALNSTSGQWIISGAKSLQIKCAQITPGQQDARATIFSPATIVAYNVWFTFSNNNYDSGNVMQFALEFWGTDNRRYEATIALTTGTSGFWQYEHDTNQAWTNFQSNAIGKQFNNTFMTPRYRGYDAPLGTIRATRSYEYIQIVANKLTGRYVSITIPEGTFQCSDLPAGCVLNSWPTDGSFGSGGTSRAQTAWGLEAQLNPGGISPTGPAYYDLFIDNVLMTDQTPGQTSAPSIAFAILNSAWILATLIPVAGLVTWTGVNRTETGREWTPKQKFMAVFGVTLMVTVLAILGIVLLSLRA